MSDRPTVEIKHCITGKVLRTYEGDSLRWADLREADLIGANLIGADLSEVQLHPPVNPQTGDIVVCTPCMEEAR